MTTVVMNTHEAKSRLSELIREAEAGSDVIVARNGRPVAKIIAWPPPRERVLGTWTGQVQVLDDIVGSDEEVIALFEQSASRTNLTGGRGSGTGEEVGDSLERPAGGTVA